MNTKDKYGLVTVLVFFSSLSTLLAQRDSSPAPASGRSRPINRYEGELEIPGFNRVVGILAEPQTNGIEAKWRYCYMPPMALKERSPDQVVKLASKTNGVKSPMSGVAERLCQHPFIFHMSEDADSVKVALRFALTSAAVQQRAVAEMEKRFAQQLAKDSAHISVNRLQLAKVVVDILDENRSTGSKPVVLATGEASNIEGASNEVEVAFSFGNQQLSDFESLLVEQPARVGFTCFVVFDAIGEVTATSSFNHATQLRVHLENFLSNQKQASGEAPLFHKQYHDLQQHLMTGLSLDVRTQDQKLQLSLTPEMLVAMIRDKHELCDIDKLGSDVKTAVAEYLKPIIQASEKTTTSGRNGKATEYQKEDSGFGFKLDLSAIVPGASFGLKDETSNIKSAEDSYGIQVIQKADTKDYFVQKIEVNYLKNLSTASGLSGRESIVQPIGGSNRRVEAVMKFGPSFTEKSMEAALGLTSPSRTYDGVPLGTMLPFFGANPPDGWKWADGKNNWPIDAEWLPKELRGKPIPDMSEGMLASGPRDGVTPGQAWRGGRMSLPPLKLDENRNSLQVPSLNGVWPLSTEGWFGRTKQAQDLAAPDFHDRIFVKLLSGKADKGTKDFIRETGIGADNSFITLHPSDKEVGPGGAQQPKRIVSENYTNVPLSLEYVARANATLKGTALTEATQIDVNTTEMTPPAVVCRWIVRLR